MSNYSNVTEQYVINLRKLAEQQKEQRALKIKNRILKQTHDDKLAESLSPITKELKKSTKKISEVIKGSNSENEKIQETVPVEIESEDENIQTNLRAPPNRYMFSDQMTKTLGRLMSSANSLKIKSSSGATILGVPIITLGGYKLRISGYDYELTPEIYKGLSYTGYDGKAMKNENDILMLNNNVRDLGYTGIGDNKSKRKTFLTETPPKLAEENQNRTYDEITLDSDINLRGEGVKIIIPSNIIDIYTRLEVRLGLKLSGHTDTLSEASALIDQLYKLGEIQNKQQYRNALNKFSN